MEISDDTQFELGQLLLSEQQGQTSNNFSLALGDFLFLHRFHESEPLALRIWLTVFLASFSAIDHPNYPIIHSTVLDVQKTHLTFIVVKSNKLDEPKQLQSVVFCFNDSDPFIDEIFIGRVHETVRQLTERHQLEPLSVFGLLYDLAIGFDSKRDEKIYKVSRSYHTINMENQQVTSQYLPFPDLEKMPKISVNNTLNFSPTTKPSILDILARYFSTHHVLKQLTKILTTRFLIRAVHAIVAGHFGQILQLTSVTSLRLRSRLNSIAMHSQAFCNNGSPVVLWADDNLNSRADFVFPPYQLPAITDFSSGEFLSFRVHCNCDSQCMWRTKIENYSELTNARQPNLHWENNQTEYLLNHLKHELVHLPLEKGTLGPFLHGYLASDRFNQIFSTRVVLMPNSTNESLNYFSFVLGVEHDLALILNVVDQPSQTNFGDDFTWFSNVHTGLSTQVINILPNQDTRLKIRSEEYKIPRFFIPGYQVITETNISRKTPNNNNNDDRKAYVMKQINQHVAKTSVEHFISTVIRLMSNMPQYYTQESQVTSFLRGLISQDVRPLALTNTNLIVYQINEKLGKQFVTVETEKPDDPPHISVQQNSFVDKLTLQPTITFHKVTLMVTDVQPTSNLSVCNQIVETSSQKYICSKRDQYNNNNGYYVSNFPDSYASDCPRIPEKGMIHFPSQIPSNSARLLLKNAIHKYLAYSLLGSNIQIFTYDVLKNLSRDGLLADFVKDPCSSNKIVTSVVDIRNQTNIPDLSDHLKWLTSILIEIHEKYTTRSDVKIIPVEDGLYMGFMENTEQQTDQLLTFALNGTQNVKSESQDTNLIFVLGPGSKAIRAGDGDDMIFISKTDQMEGIIDAKRGNDTLVLMGNSSPVTSIVESHAGNVLTLATKPGGPELTLLNVEHLVGARESYDDLHLHCGLNSVNLRGGSVIHNDFITVNMSQDCLNSVSIVLEKFTSVYHKNSNGKVVYKFVEGPVFIYVNKSTDPIKRDTVAVQFNLTDVLQLKIISPTEMFSQILIDFGSFDNSDRRRLLEIHNFHDSLTVSFNDGYQLYSKRGQFYLGRDCSMPHEVLNQLDDYLYKLLHNQNVLFTEKCPEISPTTLVYTGIVVEHNQEDQILPEKFLQLDNDPEALQTHFKIQHDPRPHVYRLDSFCRADYNDPFRCKSIVAIVETVGGDTVLDLRSVTRSFEDAGFLVDLKVTSGNPQSANVQVSAKAPPGKSSPSHFPVALIELSFEFKKISLLTSRHRHWLHDDGRVSSEYLSTRSGTTSHSYMVVAELDTRSNILAHDSGREFDQNKVERHHGDQVFDNIKCSSDTRASVLFIQRWPQCKA